MLEVVNGLITVVDHAEVDLSFDEYELFLAGVAYAADELVHAEDQGEFLARWLSRFFFELLLVCRLDALDGIGSFDVVLIGVGEIGEEQE